MANLIDEIPMLNPFDLKTGIFKHTDINVILIHKINSLNGTIVLSKGDVKEKGNIVFLNEIWNYKFEHFLDVFATDLFFYYAYEDVSYLTEDQYNQLGYLEELRTED